MSSIVPLHSAEVPHLISGAFDDGDDDDEDAAADIVLETLKPAASEHVQTRKKRLGTKQKQVE